MLPVCTVVLTPAFAGAGPQVAMRSVGVNKTRAEPEESAAGRGCCRRLDEEARVMTKARLK